MQKFGLYYPYVHPRSDIWVKMAALYWPKMARIIPAGFPNRQYVVELALTSELEYFIDVDPAAAANAIAARFKHDLETGIERFRSAYRVALIKPRREIICSCWPPPVHICCLDATATAMPDPQRWESAETNSYKDLRYAGVWPSHLGSTLREYLLNEQLAVWSATSKWLIMHPDIAWAYMCTLANEISSQNDLVAITDQTVAHAVTSPRMVQQLISAPEGRASDRRTNQLIDQFGLMAIRLVIPAHIDEIPIERIIMLRKRYGGEFDAFTAAINDAALEFRDHLTNITDIAVLNAYLAEEVRRRFSQPVKELRSVLRGLKIDAGFAAANVKFELPAAAIAIGGVVAGQPIVAAAGGAAFGVFSIRHTIRQRRANAMQASTVSYLLRIEDHLTSRSLLQRVMGSMRAGIN